MTKRKKSWRDVLVPGEQLKHGPTLGYIVLELGPKSGDCGVGALCVGMSDSRHRILRYGHPVTLFKTRRAAARAIRDTAKECPERNVGRFVVIRVAELAE